MRTSTLVFSLVVVTLASGCGAMEAITTTRAANDFGCPEGDVHLSNVGGTSFRADGCGQSATYTCIQSTDAVYGPPDYACVRER
jgi:hypothetical protein